MKAGLRRAAAVAAMLAASLPSLDASAQAAREFDVPPYAGAYQPSNGDERGLWMIDDESERMTRDSNLIIRDEGLNAYVRSVFCRTVGDDRCQAVRLYIMRVPHFNASMSPNGTMRIYSGLLLRMRSEAELASVLGHEFAHFELRHSLEDFRRRRNASDLLAWTAVAGMLAATYGAGGASSYGDLRVSVFGALASYNRDQERAADLLGLSYMAQAGFRPSASSDVWRSMMNEADATAAARNLKSKRYSGTPFFASHPTNLERADYLSAMANRVAGGEYEGRKAYLDGLGAWVDAFLADQIKLNDFGGSDYMLQRLGAEEWNPSLLTARGELYRLRANPRDLPHAVEFYRQALAINDQLPVAQKGMGLSLMRLGQLTEGKAALNKYLELHPDAEDAAMIRTLVASQ